MTKALEARYEDEDYASHKPCTTVYKLVEELNKPEEVIARLNRQSGPKSPKCRQKLICKKS